MRQAKKERKKFQSRIPFVLDPGNKIPKKIAKQFTKSNNLFSAVFLTKRDEIGRKGEKKNMSGNPFILDQGKKILKNNSKKIQKKLFPALFIAKMGCGRPRKGENNFSPK